MAHFEKKCSIGANVETKFNALWKKKSKFVDIWNINVIWRKKPVCDRENLYFCMQ